MAISPLVRIKDSQFFLPNTIAICTDGDRFTIVHGGFNKAETPGWDNGRHPVSKAMCPGAYDSQAQQNAVSLLKPLLTGEDRVPNRFGWCIGDLAVAAGTGTFAHGSILQLYRYDDSSSPVWSLVTGSTEFTCADGMPGAYASYSLVERITPHFDIPKDQPEEQPMTHRTGDYIYCPDLTDEQIEAFVHACRPHVKEVEHGYMGYVRGNYPYLAIDDDKDLWTFPNKRRFMTNNVTDQYKGDSSMSTTRNPFQNGDLVVPNGFKYFGDRMRHGSNPDMQEWETKQTVLKVTGTGSSTLRAGTDYSDGYTYHYSEVRMATDREIQAAKQPEKPPVVLKNGSLIKLQGTVYMVTRVSRDSENRIRAISVDSGSVRLITVRGPDAEAFTVLGQIMEDGDFRPAESGAHAEASAPTASDPKTWKKGQRVRCVTDQRAYVTKGRVYTLIEDARVSTDRHGTVFIKIHDNDGDRATYRVTDESPNFIAV